MTAPLAGIRVVDLTRVLAGPFCGQLLVQLGAEVLKVEDPRGGDEGRHMSPTVKGQPVYYNSINRGKRGVTLNLRHADGRALLERLVERSDVVLESFRPGTLDAMGMGLAHLRELNPRIVLISISGFGQTGPYKHRPAFDQCAQAMSGVMALTGEPRGKPTRVGAFIGDYLTGVYAALATVAALRQRDMTGEAVAADVAMLDALLSTTVMDICRSLSGNTPKRSGNAHPYVAPSNVYRAKDGRYVFISAPSDRLWGRLVGAMGRPELTTDPEYSTSEARNRRRRRTDAQVKAWVAARSADEVVDACDRASVPCAPVLDIAEAARDPQIWERRLVEWQEHPRDGRVALAGSPLKLSGTDMPAPGFPPELGEHNAEVFGGLLGLAAEEIARLREAGAV